METGNDSPPLRTTILGSFLGRGRPRNSSQSHIDIPRELSPSPPHPHANANAQPASPNPYTMIVQGGGGPGGGAPGRSHRGRAAPSPTTNPPSATPAGLSLGHMLRRRRSAGNIPQQQQGHAGPAPMVPPTPGGRATAPMNAAIASGLVAANGNTNANSTTNTNANTGGGNGPSHRIRLVPHLDSRRSLRFDAISRDLRAGEPALRIGRFTDRSGLGLAAVNALSMNKIAFKSKVVSRAMRRCGSRILVQVGRRRRTEVLHTPVLILVFVLATAPVVVHPSTPISISHASCHIIFVSFPPISLSHMHTHTYTSTHPSIHLSSRIHPPWWVVDGSLLRPTSSLLTHIAPPFPSSLPPFPFTPFCALLLSSSLLMLANTH
ncbi:hypothetical protein B0H13DRAFT_2651742 [Mycena leptocephala]|nr:hypothetical protein B0H13DRAFT_2651742 [Mycena leptocephala]